MPSPPQVARITGFDLQVIDPARSARFYREALGFIDAAAERGAPCVRLGEVRLRLVAAAPGTLAPAPAAADAPGFQHFAIRVRDMAAAHARVAAAGVSAISRDGPQRLPPSDGSVTAWKFRDPDGHPLELLQPATTAAAGPLFEAIDHTALACADPAASLAFYGALGLTQGASSHNHGAPQDRLDGLDGVDLRISTVHTRGAGPHIELLHYLQPASPPRAAWTGAPFVLTRLEARGAPGELRDPDGHRLEADGAEG